jgi:hypothetical protein
MPPARRKNSAARRLKARSRTVENRRAPSPEGEIRFSVFNKGIGFFSLKKWSFLWTIAETFSFPILYGFCKRREKAWDYKTSLPLFSTLPGICPAFPSLLDAVSGRFPILAYIPERLGGPSKSFPFCIKNRAFPSPGIARGRMKRTLFTIPAEG